MADTDVDRFRFSPAAYGHPDALTPMMERRDAAGGPPRHTTLANKQTLRTTNAGAIEEYAYMAGKTEAPRMSKSLAIEQEYIGFATQPPQHGDD